MNKVISFEHAQAQRSDEAIEDKVRSLIQQMTLAEKIGQMRQVDATCDRISDSLAEDVRTGSIGSVINQTDPELCNELQRIATQESRLGIPLLIARDVIHGFGTIMPIPLGQAATWNPDLVQQAASIAAQEAASCGVNWTFSPMIDISRDARWGRIAESLGEDPYLTATLGVAMTRGYQGDDLAQADSIAACAKHFVGYGASESGRDYNTTNIPTNELRNVYLPPFKAVLDAGAQSIMASFSDIDGVPASANGFLMRDILRDEWRFDGIAISDWNSISQLAVHGLTADDRESALQAVRAGLDIEMAGDAYDDHLKDLVMEGKVSIELVETMVANILRTKVRLGLFEDPFTNTNSFPSIGSPQALDVAKSAAIESVVMLKNDNNALPLAIESLQSIAVIGPMADAPYEQLGTWIFDADTSLSVTPLQAIKQVAPSDVTVHFARAMASTRSKSTELFSEAVAATKASDVALVFLGEESILSGEAHSRADIGLPGNQTDLVKALKETGKPVVAVILAGRPLTLGDVIEHCDAVFFAWHLGTMAGPAIADLLFGAASPSGKLPVSFPKMVGQIPIYYNHKNSGRPPSPDTVIHIDEIEVGTPQTSLGMTAFHLDAGYEPQFPFGFGLSYTEFKYDDLRLSKEIIGPDDTLTVSVQISNVGKNAGSEVAQLYIRDLVGSVTRPVRELKRFSKFRLEAGETRTIEFPLSVEDLCFWRRDGSYGFEPGRFSLWVGGSSMGDLKAEFAVTEQ